jgi:hypothetical protein
MQRFFSHGKGRYSLKKSALSAIIPPGEAVFRLFSIIFLPMDRNPDLNNGVFVDRPEKMNIDNY